MPDKKLWINNGKIVTRDGKVIECDDCPCACCSPDYVTIEFIAVPAPWYNAGVHVLQKWDRQPIPSPLWIANGRGPQFYTPSYGGNSSYFKWVATGQDINAGIFQYISCLNNLHFDLAGRPYNIYMEIWDDAHLQGPVYQYFIQGNLCVPFTENRVEFIFNLTPVFL